MPGSQKKGRVMYRDSEMKNEGWFEEAFQPLDEVWAMENEIKKYEVSKICDRCGYVDCICTLNRP